MYRINQEFYCRNFRQVLRKREPVYQALWAGPGDFDEVLISPVMIQDHMPDNMLKALNKVSLPVNVRRGTIRDSRYEQTPVSRSPSVKPGTYELLEETNGGLESTDFQINDIKSSEINEDVKIVENRSRERDSIISSTVSIVVDIHENPKS